MLQIQGAKFRFPAVSFERTLYFQTPPLVDLSYAYGNAIAAHCILDQRQTHGRSKPVDIRTIENEVLRLEKKYWQAMKDRDVETMLLLTDVTCIVAGPQGVVKFSQDDFRKMADSDSYEIIDFEIREHQVTVIDEQTAVIAYKVEEHIEVDGERLHFEASDSSTWIKRSGKWVCCPHTESLKGDPFGRDIMKVKQIENGQSAKNNATSNLH